MSEPTSYSLRFGTMTRDYVLYTTNAPAVLDHGQTLTLYGEAGLRYILIQRGAVATTVTRIELHGYWVQPAADFSGDGITARLWSVFLGVVQPVGEVVPK